MSAIFLYAVVLLVAGKSKMKDKSKYMYVWVWEVKWGEEG